MPVNPSGLADEMADSMGQDVTDELKGIAQGILDELTLQGIATFGLIPGPHPVVGLTPPTMAAKIVSAGGAKTITPQLLGLCTGIVSGLATAIVTYAAPPQTIPPIAPILDWFTGGLIAGLAGPVMAVQISSALGFPAPTPELINMANSIVNHIQANAQVESGKIS